MSNMTEAEFEPNQYGNHWHWERHIDDPTYVLNRLTHHPADEHQHWKHETIAQDEAQRP